VAAPSPTCAWIDGTSWWLDDRGIAPACGSADHDVAMPRVADAWIAAYSLRPARAGRPRGVSGEGPAQAWRCTRMEDRAGEPVAGVASFAFMTDLRTRDICGLPSA
jgi:hypothetical protein